MGFFTGLQAAFTTFGAGKAFGGGLQSGLGSAFMGEFANRLSGGRRRREHMQFGRQRNQLELAQFEALRGMGLTPQEIIGSTGAGAYGSDAGQFGNGQAAQAMAQMQQAQLQQETQIRAIEIQGETARDVARINAGVQTRGQDITEKLGVSRIELDRERLKWQKFAEGVKLTQEQKRLDADLPLKDKRWLLHMKMLSMGVNNVIASGIVAHLKHAGFDVLDPGNSTKTASEILIEILHFTKKTATEVRDEILPEPVKELTNKVFDIFGDIFGGEGEAHTVTGEGRGSGGNEMPPIPPPGDWNSPNPPEVVR